MAAAEKMTERPTSEQWDRVKQRLRTELGEDVFSSWFGRVEFEEADVSSVYLSVPTRFLKSWISAHYSERLLALWDGERKGIARVELIVRSAMRFKAPVDVEKTERAYRVYAKKAPQPNGDYAMDHTAIVYLMDKDGRFVAPFNAGRKVEDAAADLRRYI